MTSEHPSTAQASRPPGRPREFDVDEALDVLLELVWTRGYGATSLLDMVEATGLGKSSLRAAFGTKDEIMAAVLAHYAQRVIEPVIARVRDGDAGLADITRLFEALETVARARARAMGCAATNLAVELGARGEAVSRLHAQLRARLRRAIVAALARAATLGEIAHEQLDARAELLLTLFFGGAALTRAGATPAERRLRMTAVTALLQSFRVTPRG
ncbi:MAG: TetR/AcrR family transcriptional regulator [Gemmatimonadaceae bacterium]|jgi:TetR/AcrR family transcriptional repressor of nem operon|nr:TetR/AcrR family transcriptional regulator [Gemmatimonadaceae bacterium]